MKEVKLRVVVSITAHIEDAATPDDFIAEVEYEFGSAGYGIGCAVDTEIVNYEVMEENQLDETVH
jgi:hypothetical protein